tara:strand:+ start:3275 stop:4159 length:885 start_codon:yes stop_codon:yes gene_type:complete
MKLNKTLCKSILTRTSGYLKEVSSHSVNPYVGCGFGKSSCGVGCYVRHNQWLLKGREWGGFIDVKMNSAEIYCKTWKAEKNWAVKRGLRFSLFCSSSTDPWQPMERKYRVTRRLLEAIRDSPPEQLILQTHSDLVRDDRNLILELSKVCDLRLHVSIEGDRDSLPEMPPPPCSVRSRLDVVEDFAGLGVCVVVCVSPLYPMINPQLFFEHLRKSGVRAVVIDHFIEGDGSKEGSRTLRTFLPKAIARIDAKSNQLSYRDKIVAIAKEYLPVGISRNGFAGNYFYSGEISAVSAK